MINKFYFDTYALVEIYKGNPNYEGYKEDVDLMLNELNILEYVYFLIRENRGGNLKQIFENLKKFAVEYDDTILVDAAKMKFEYKKDKLSYVDCVGYIIAKKKGVRFLTGDEKFKGRANVEFVK